MIFWNNSEMIFLLACKISSWVIITDNCGLLIPCEMHRLKHNIWTRGKSLFTSYANDVFFVFWGKNAKYKLYFLINSNKNTCDRDFETQVTCNKRCPGGVPYPHKQKVNLKSITFCVVFFFCFQETSVIPLYRCTIRYNRFRLRFENSKKIFQLLWSLFRSFCRTKN